MKKKSNYTERRQHDRSKMQSIIVCDLNSKDFVKNKRIECLEKRNSILNKNKETYLINEPDELDIKCYW